MKLSLPIQLLLLTGSVVQPSWAAHPCRVGLDKGTKCSADKTSWEVAGGLSLWLPSFWKSAAVDRNPSHD